MDLNIRTWFQILLTLSSSGNLAALSPEDNKAKSYASVLVRVLDGCGGAQTLAVHRLPSRGQVVPGLPMPVLRVLLGLPADGPEEVTVDGIEALLEALAQHVENWDVERDLDGNVVFERVARPAAEPLEPPQLLEDEPDDLVDILCQAAAPTAGLEVGIGDDRLVMAAANEDGVLVLFDGERPPHRPNNELDGERPPNNELADLERQIDHCRAQLAKLLERRAYLLRSTETCRKRPGPEDDSAIQTAPKRAALMARLPFVPPEGPGWQKEVVDYARHLHEADEEEITWICHQKRPPPGFRVLDNGFLVKRTGEFVSFANVPDRPFVRRAASPQRGVVRPVNTCFLEAGLRLAAALPVAAQEAGALLAGPATPAQRWLASAILAILGRDIKEVGLVDGAVDLSRYSELRESMRLDMERGALAAPILTFEVLSECADQPDDPRAIFGLLHGLGIIPPGHLAVESVSLFECDSRHGPDGSRRAWRNDLPVVIGHLTTSTVEFPVHLPPPRPGAPFTIQALLTELLETATVDCLCGEAALVRKGTTPVPRPGSSLLLRLDREDAPYVGDHFVGELNRSLVVASPEITLSDGSRFELRAVLHHTGEQVTRRGEGSAHYYCDIRTGARHLTRYDGNGAPQLLDVAGASSTGLFYLYSRLLG